MKNYTTTQASEKIGVGITGIQAAIWRGKLLAFKQGRDWLIDGKELDRWNKVRRKRAKAKN